MRTMLRATCSGQLHRVGGQLSRLLSPIPANYKAKSALRDRARVDRHPNHGIHADRVKLVYLRA